jgi:hypothetical protein
LRHRKPKRLRRLQIDEHHVFCGHPN